MKATVANFLLFALVHSAVGKFFKPEFELAAEGEEIDGMIEFGPPDCTKMPNTFLVTPCRSSTQPSCREPRPLIQLHDCRIYCACISGYVLDNNGNCIRHEECPENAQCIAQDANSEFTTCRMSPRKTCQNYNPNQVGFYPWGLVGLGAECNIGCECKPGFIFDETTQKCVQFAQCL